jgi:hypothetical protein
MGLSGNVERITEPSAVAPDAIGIFPLLFRSVV